MDWSLWKDLSMNPIFYIGSMHQLRCKQMASVNLNVYTGGFFFFFLKETTVRESTAQ